MMSRTGLPIAGALLLLVVIALGATPAAPPTDVIARLEARVAELEKRLAALESQMARITSPAPATTQPQVAGVKVANPAEVPLVLDDWDYKVTKGDFGQEYYRISLRLRNAGAKQIKLIDASVRFTDLLDQSLYGVKVSPDIAIAPGKMQIEEGDYSINQFMNEQSRMKNMKKADIKATLQVRRIVFSDNTVLQVER